MSDFIEGTIKKMIYKNDNGYIVGTINVKKTSDNYDFLIGEEVAFTGYFTSLVERENYKLYGVFKEHYKYGEQFNVSFYDLVLPEEKDSLIEFLSGGTFKGIGEKTAKKIVSHLGEETLNIIINNPSTLLLIPQVSQKQIDVLHTTLIRYENSYKIILSLNELGFNSKDSIIIYNLFKEKTTKILENNIYLIYESLKEISFKKIDTIALKHEYAFNDFRRLKAAIIYTFEELINAFGNSYLNLEEIYNYTIKVLEYRLLEEEFLNAIESLIMDTKIIKEEDKYFLDSMYNAEEYIVSRIKVLVNKDTEEPKKLNALVKDVASSKSIIYNAEQLLAISKSMKENILIITGGPGTGKTTIVSSIVYLYQKITKSSKDKIYEELVLLAPTGRAGKRLQEKTNYPASTIHSYLKWNKDQNKFSVNENNKSNAKFVIIDEASMVDTLLFDNLLRGLKIDTKIIMVGDYNQLPSVGPGQLLKDLIESEMIETIYLKELYRQQEGSSIITLARDINEGLLDYEVFSDTDDLELFTNNVDIITKIKELYLEYKNHDYQNIQVLAPMYKGLLGIDNLNKELQKTLNPSSKTKKELRIGDVTYREKDKVLQLVNMPEEKIFNGDLGIIHSIDNKTITIDFDSTLVRFTASNFKNFQHGYAISIHKSQGSEFDIVILPVVNAYKRMLYRKLYYTAVTRSKKKLYILGDMGAFEYSISNNIQDLRKTTIKDRLIKRIIKY